MESMEPMNRWIGEPSKVYLGRLASDRRTLVEWWLKLKRALLRRAGSFAFHAGLIPLLTSVSKYHCLIILCYHRVGDCAGEEFLPSRTSRTPIRSLEKTIRYLRGCGFEFVALRDYVEAVRRGEADQFRKCVALTFDDGLKSQFEHGFPVLRKYDLPATFFINSSSVGSSRLLWFHLAYYLVHKVGIDSMYQYISGAKPCYFHDEAECAFYRSPSIAMLMQILMGSTRETRDDIIAEFRSNYSYLLEDEASLANELYISDCEILELIDDGMTIGAHGDSHQPLTSLTPSEQRMQIIRSKERLEGIVGKPIELFSYPFGALDSCSKRIVREAGFWGATSTVCELSSLEDPDLYALPRICLADEPLRLIGYMLFRAHMLSRL